MAQEKIPEVNKTAEMTEQVKLMLPYASNILLQSLMGLPTNDERRKDARFALNLWKSSQVLDKEKTKVALAERRFNFSVLNLYGDDEQKKQIKALVKSSFPKMKFLEK